VPVPFLGTLTEASLETIKELFHRRHEQLYTYCERDNHPELGNVEVTVLGRNRASVEGAAAITGDEALRKSQQAAASRRVYLEESGDYTVIPIHDGRHVTPGVSLTGPVTIEEPTTTIVVPPDWVADCRPGGFYLTMHAGAGSMNEVTGRPGSQPCAY